MALLDLVESQIEVACFPGRLIQSARVNWDHEDRGRESQDVAHLDLVARLTGGAVSPCCRIQCTGPAQSSL